MHPDHARKQQRRNRGPLAALGRPAAGDRYAKGKISTTLGVRPFGSHGQSKSLLMFTAPAEVKGGRAAGG